MRRLLPALVLVALLVPSAAAVAAPAAKRCVGAEEASAAGEDGGPPKFTSAFYARMFTLDASLDGVDRDELPISIEEVCGVPKRLAKQAAQLAGADGVALLLPRTTFWEGTTQLLGPAAATALEGADTANVRVRLTRPRAWHDDEDGEPIPTFRAGRIEITD